MHTTGTGFVAARTVAEKGGEAVLLNRKSSRVDTMLEALQKAVPDGKFVTVECDLQDFDSVRKAAQEVIQKYSSNGGIYCLSNNAGIMATPDRATKDGFDEQMQTNHLSHFLLTQQLFPLLKQYASSNNNSAAPRIVNHSSAARHGTANKTLERKYLEPTGGDGNLGGDKMGIMSGPCFERYCQSKLANSVFTHALHDKLQQEDTIKVVAVHPGASATNLGDHLKFGWFTDFLTQNIIFPLIAQSSEDGTMGLLKGMMGKDESVESGVLYGPNSMKGPAVAQEPKPWEIDDEAKKILWETSEAATGVTFTV